MTFTIEDWYLLFLLPFGAAVAARLMYNRWQAWVVLAAAAVVAWALFQYFMKQELATGNVLVAIAIGLLGPEIWAAIRNVAQRPRTWAWVIGAAGLLYCLSRPDVGGAVLAIACIFFGMRFWLRRRPQRRH